MSKSGPSSDGKNSGDARSSSSSAIVAKTVVGSHDLKIKGYCLTKRLGNGKFITSETFAVGGHRWYLRYYPNGWRSSDIGWVSFILFLDDNDASGVTAEYKVTLLDQHGNPVPLYMKGTRKTFSSKKAPENSHAIISHRELERSVYLKDDVFSIRCDLTLLSILAEVAPPLDVPVPPSDLQLHFSQLLSGGEGTDVTLEVGTETFAAHRCVLAARSSVFRAVFLGSMKEKADARVRIEDTEANVFKAMLHFIYTDSLPLVEESDAVVMAQHLLVVADRYNLERLKCICDATLRRYMDTTTTATTLALAEQHGCHGLKDACLKFLASPGNFKEVMASDGFVHLMKSCPSLHKELAANLPSS
ncbi:BTB/POZ and MATH domain-containing protein 2-like [Lolium rigidum]|uniref:BTB/POZ and MATH domain-containing protein 2-like n=1 Tax=Lolium rigidum TaxID=89674 RepID=UPI001F5D3F62|nr:BTB/POZ and MATH domain-containing protein 2-like [Lolium rigidum]